MRALAREEGQPDVWSRLGAVYRKPGDETALETLDRRHRKRFGVALRPAW